MKLFTKKTMQPSKSGCIPPDPDTIPSPQQSTGAAAAAVERVLQHADPDPNNPLKDEKRNLLLAGLNS